MKEYTMHNVRFYNFEPQSIQCMAYEDESYRLALARADGSIELWNCEHQPFLQDVILGDIDTTIEALVWCNDRLFSVGLDGFLQEYDTKFCRVKLRVPVTGGATWCLELSHDKTLLAAGTEQGYVCLFALNDEGVIYETVLPKQDARILSLAWHVSGKYLAMGSVNGLGVYSFDEKKLSRFGFANRKVQEIDVWCVGILNDMTVISGDSRGKICFWNYKVGIITQAIQTHRAPIMSLITSQNQTTLYAAGVDPVVVQLKYVEGKKDNWVLSNSRNIHTHDVRALALTKDEKLYSGGVDTMLGLSYFPPKVIVKYPAPVYPGTISIARNSEFILLHYKDNMQLWCLGAPGDEHRDKLLTVLREPVKVLEMKCKEEQIIEWCAVSPSANYIAYIVQGRLRIFKLQLPKDANKLSVERVKNMSKDMKGSTQILWMTENKISSVTEDGSIQIINVSNNETTIKCEVKVESGNLVKRMKCDPKGNVLVVLDHKGEVSVFNLESDTSSKLPHYYAPVSAFGIHPATLNVVVVYADMMVKEYSTKSNQYTSFSRRLLTEIPREFVTRKSGIHDVSFDPLNNNLIFLHDDYSIIVLKKLNALKEKPDSKPSKLQRTDRKNPVNMNGHSEFNSYSIINIKKKNQILHFTHIDNNSVVSVEVDNLQLLHKLPEVLREKKFGAK